MGFLALIVTMWCATFGCTIRSTPAYVAEYPGLALATPFACAPTNYLSNLVST